MCMIGICKVWDCIWKVHVRSGYGLGASNLRSMLANTLYTCPLLLLQQPASGAAPRKRGWFGRKNTANTPAATSEPTAPGTPAATAGAPGTATGTEAPAPGGHAPPCCMAKLH